MSACWRRLFPVWPSRTRWRRPISSRDRKRVKAGRRFFFHAPRRVGVDVAARGRERHDLPEKCESVVGIAGGGAAEGIEPSLLLGRGNAVERLRSEGGQEPSVEKPGHASPGRWLLSVEMSLFPRVLDEIPEQRGGVRRPGGPVRLGTRLVLKALSPDLGDALQQDRAERDAFRGAVGLS